MLFKVVLPWFFNFVKERVCGVWRDVIDENLIASVFFTEGQSLYIHRANSVSCSFLWNVTSRKTVIIKARARRHWRKCNFNPRTTPEKNTFPGFTIFRVRCENNLSRRETRTLVLLVCLIVSISPGRANKYTLICSDGASFVESAPFY